MIASATREGLSRAWALRGLVAAVWLIHLALATAAAFPLWRTLDGLIAPLPGADALRGGIRLGVLADIAELRPGLIGAIALVALVVVGVGLLVGAAISAGVLEALRDGDRRSLGHRFGRGAGRFFGRFVRLGIAVGAIFGILGTLGVAPFLFFARAHLREGTGAGWPSLVGGLTVAALAFILGTLVHDAARILIVRSDGRVGPGLRTAFGTVLRHPVPWLGTWLANAALVGVAVVLYLTLRAAFAPETGALLLVTVLLQQAFVLTRTGLRVALLGSEAALVEALVPVAGGRTAEATLPQSDPGSSSPAA